MTAMAQALSAALLDFVWQGLLTAFLLWVALFILRDRSARTRYAASCIALGVMAALPVITVCLWYRAPSVSPVAVEWAKAGTQTIAAAAQASGAPSFDWTEWVKRWALPAWAAGVWLFSLRLVWAARQISLLRRKALPPEAPLAATVAALQERLRLSRPVRVWISAAAECPSVVGWFRPIVLLPAATLIGLTSQQLEAVLAHELAHILRYDYLVNMLQSVVETLLFYHPAVWWTSKRIRQERELCCDDVAVESCGDAVVYARALTRLERLRIISPQVAVGSTGGSLFYRIQRLVGDGQRERGPSKVTGILALFLGLVCLALNLQWARGQQKAASPQEAATVEAYVADAPGVHVNLGGAEVIHRDAVDYPDNALEKGIQGTVVVEATLDEAGAVSDAHVVSGPRELRKAALESVLNWHFGRDAAGGIRQVSIEFQKPAEGARAKHTEEQARREKEARALLAAAHEQQEVEGLVQKELARKMAKQKRDLEERQAVEVMELQKRLAEQAERMPAGGAEASEKLARELAEGQHQAGELEKELQILGSQRLVLENQSGLLEARRAQIEIEKKMAEMQTHIGGVRSLSLAGSRVKVIQVQGLSAPAREELMSKFPVHLGDTLEEDSMRKIEETVKQFDEHLGLSVFTRDGQVEIYISAPNSRDRSESRR